MKVCGVIAEYNPFHNGHAHQLAATRAQLGAETAMVAVMSGNYTQRGDLAILEKYRRAQTAVQCGADLVLELPLGAALSSAEGFARGGVAALDALGFVTHLSFGSECGDVQALIRAAQLLDSPACLTALRECLQKGMSYAAARQQALPEPALADLLRAPNNTLGIEYCRALAASCGKMQPITIARRGAAHDNALTADGFASASLLRGFLSERSLSVCRDFLPAASHAMLEAALADGQAPIGVAALDTALLCHLRRLSAADFARFDSSDEGFHNRLAQAVAEGTCFADVCARAQTRRYPLSRVRRALLRAWLDLPLADTALPPQYLRVLAIGAQGRALLRRAANNCTLPIITKPLHEKQLPAALQPALRRDALADDLYCLAAPHIEHHIGGVHFRKSPFCVSVDT